MKYFIPVAISLGLISCERNSISWQEINSQIENKFSSVSHLSVDQFISEYEDNNDILLIDVREAEEFSVSHIPGAINIQDAHDIAALANSSDKDVVVYCSVGYRSADIAEQLQAIGMNDVANLKGSIFAWANSGLPLSNTNGTTREVHPYDNFWGQLLNEDVPKRY